MTSFTQIGATFAAGAGITALTGLLFKDSLASIGVVTLDASIKELHSATAKATRHPIEAEDGAIQTDISDHVRADPVTLDIQGLVTNHPPDSFIDFLERKSIDGIGKNYAVEAYSELLETILTGKIVTIVTTLAEYPNMVLEDVKVTRDAQKGNALYFSARAVMLTLVTLQETALGVAAVDGATKNKGKKPPKPATAANSGKASFIQNLRRAFR